VATKQGDVKVNISADIRELRKQLHAAERATQTWQKRMKKIGTGMRNIGRDMTMGFTLPIVAGLALATKAAIEDQKSQEMLAVQVRKVTDATAADIEVMEEWIDQRARATGVADDELRPALSRLVAATGDVKEAQKLLALSQDVATSTGKKLDTVILAMIKGTTGVTGGFGRMGIATKNAKGEALSFDEILAELEKKFGGSTAKAADTAAGKMARLKVAFQETAEDIGRILLPFVEKLADWIGTLAEKFDGLSPTTKKVIVVIGLVLAVLGPLLMLLGQIIMIAPAVGAAFTLMGGPVTIIAAAILILIGLLVTLYIKNERFRDIVNKVAGVLKTVFIKQIEFSIGVVKALYEAVQTLIGWFGRFKRWVATSTLGKIIATALTPGIVALMKAYDLASWLWDKLRALGLFAKKGITIPIMLRVNTIGDIPQSIASHVPTGHWTIRDGRKVWVPEAAGGVVTRPTFALVGEAGPEAIIPLSRPRRAAQVMEQAGLTSGPLIVHVHWEGGIIGSADAVGAALAPALERALVKTQTRRARGF